MAKQTKIVTLSNEINSMIMTDRSTLNKERADIDQTNEKRCS